MNLPTISAFRLPEHLSHKASAALISGDDEHFAEIAETLHTGVAEASARLDRMLCSSCPSRSFTIVGDRAQARHGFTESWDESGAASPAPADSSQWLSSGHRHDSARHV